MNSKHHKSDAVWEEGGGEFSLTGKTVFPFNRYYKH